MQTAPRSDCNRKRHKAVLKGVTQVTGVHDIQALIYFAEQIGNGNFTDAPGHTRLEIKFGSVTYGGTLAQFRKAVERAPVRERVTPVQTPKSLLRRNEAITRFCQEVVEELGAGVNPTVREVLPLTNAGRYPQEATHAK